MQPLRDSSATLAAEMASLGRAARAAQAVVAESPVEQRNSALFRASTALRDGISALLEANSTDLAAARVTPAMADRLRLDESRILAMAAGLEAIAALPDPLGRVLARWSRPNGLEITRISVPLGVIGVIYEARPNVTADAGALCLKAGNATILRPGSESFRSSSAILSAIHQGLTSSGLPSTAIQMVPTRDRAAVGIMLAMDDAIDVIVPRGGKSLVARVQAEARVPVLAHLDGNCHVYVDGAADLAMAARIAFNAKLRRTGVCGAAETLLLDRRLSADAMRAVIGPLLGAACELRGDPAIRALDARVRPAAPADWDIEYLDAILAVGVVDGVEGAIAHIARHGSHHTDAIVTENAAAAERFLAAVDSAIVLHNASTQFADGGEFGMGAEIGIATGRLHARGPVGVEQLTTFKYVVRGDGQVRP